MNPDYYQTNRNNLTLPLVWQQRVVNLNRFGAPHDLLLLDDLLEGNLPPYKLYIFLNPFHLNQSRREALKRVLRKKGRTALWIYAPGYLNSDLPTPISLEHMTDLTGFCFGRAECYWGPFMHLTDFTHPITRELPQDFFWGSTQPIGPVFYLQDPEATTLGQVVYSGGACKPGLGVKTLIRFRARRARGPQSTPPCQRFRPRCCAALPALRACTSTMKPGMCSTRPPTCSPSIPFLAARAVSSCRVVSKWSMIFIMTA